MENNKFCGVGGLDLIMLNIEKLENIIEKHFEKQFFKNVNMKDCFIMYETSLEKIMQLKWSYEYNKKQDNVVFTNWQFEFLLRDEKKRQEIKTQMEGTIKNLVYEWQEYFKNNKKGMQGGIELIMMNLGGIDKFFEMPFFTNEDTALTRIDYSKWKYPLCDEDNGDCYSCDEYRQNVYPCSKQKWDWVHTGLCGGNLEELNVIEMWKNKKYIAELGAGQQFDFQKNSCNLWSKWDFEIQNNEFDLKKTEQRRKDFEFERIKKRLLRVLMNLRYDWQEKAEEQINDITGGDLIDMFGTTDTIELQKIIERKKRQDKVKNEIEILNNTIWSNGKNTKIDRVIELYHTTRINKIIEQLEAVKELDNKAIADFTDCFLFYSPKTKEENIERLVNNLKEIVSIYKTNDLEEVKEKYLEYVGYFEED